MNHAHSTANRTQTQEGGVCPCSPSARAVKCWTSSISSVSSPWSLVPPSLGITWFPLTKKEQYPWFHTEHKKIVEVPFVQDYTSYQNHILLCKRSPKERIHIVMLNTSMSKDAVVSVYGLYLKWQSPITEPSITDMRSDNLLNYHSILVTNTGWLLQVIPLEDL